MKLLHVIHTLNPASGGTAAAVRNFVANAGDSTQEVLTLDRCTDPWNRQFDARIHTVGPTIGKYGYTRRLVRWLSENVWVYDALVIHGCWQFHGLATSRAAQCFGVPYFLFPHGMLDPYFKSVSRTKHLKKLLYWPFERTVLERSAAVFFTCAEEFARAHRAFPFRTVDEIVPLGLDAPALGTGPVGALADQFPETKGKRLLLYLGRLHPKKGADLLIRAFSELRDPAFHLVIAGPPATEGYLQELRQLSAPISAQVTFTGMLTGTLKASALSSAEALVLPSHQENFGFSAVEALAHGKPVLLSDKVNIWREIVTDCAGLVTADTPAGVIDLLRRWRSLSTEEIAAMSAAARHCFHSRFRAEPASQHFLAAIRKLTANTYDRASSPLQLVHA